MVEGQEDRETHTSLWHLLHARETPPHKAPLTRSHRNNVVVAHRAQRMARTPPVPRTHTQIDDTRTTRTHGNEGNTGKSVHTVRHRRQHDCSTHLLYMHPSSHYLSPQKNATQTQQLEGGHPSTLPTPRMVPKRNRMESHGTRSAPYPRTETPDHGHHS